MFSMYRMSSIPRYRDRGARLAESLARGACAYAADDGMGDFAAQRQASFTPYVWVFWENDSSIQRHLCRTRLLGLFYQIGGEGIPFWGGIVGDGGMAISGQAFFYLLSGD